MRYFGLLAFSGLLSGIVVGIVNPALAETLRLAHHHAVGGQTDQTAERFAALVAEKTNGRIEIRISPAGRLGQ
jgi:TRAP-type C4-dicarboxylate transport system substrate-binding protein